MSITSKAAFQATLDPFRCIEFVHSLSVYGIPKLRTGAPAMSEPVQLEGRLARRDQAVPLRRHNRIWSLTVRSRTQVEHNKHR